MHRNLKRKFILISSFVNFREIYIEILSTALQCFG